MNVQAIFNTIETQHENYDLELNDKMIISDIEAINLDQYFTPTETKKKEYITKARKERRKDRAQQKYNNDYITNNADARQQYNYCVIDLITKTMKKTNKLFSIAQNKMIDINDMKVKVFIDKYIYDQFSDSEKIGYLEGSVYPDEEYLQEVADENNIKIIW